jgi:large repetitive protein
VDIDTLLIEVAPFNDPPIAKDDLIDTPEGTPVTFDPLADNGNGPDSAGPNEDGFQTIQVIAVDPVGTSGGTTAWNPSTGLVTYTPPNADFFGTDTFTYTIEDDGESMIDGVRQPDPKTAIGTVTVTVLARNDAPHAEDDLLLIPPLPQAGQQIVFPAAALLGNDNPGPANESNQVLRILSVQMMAGTKGTIELLDKGTADRATTRSATPSLPTSITWTRSCTPCRTTARANSASTASWSMWPIRKRPRRW